MTKVPSFISREENSKRKMIEQNELEEKKKKQEEEKKKQEEEKKKQEHINKIMNTNYSLEANKSFINKYITKNDKNSTFDDHFIISDNNVIKILRINKRGIELFLKDEDLRQEKLNALKQAELHQMISIFEYISVSLEDQSDKLEEIYKFSQDLFVKKMNKKLTFCLKTSDLKNARKIVDQRNDINTICIEHPLRNIPQSSFKNCNNITSVNIKCPIDEIGSESFLNCISLRDIYINNVINICSRAFMNCSSLTTITIPNSTKTIGENAFEGCSSLEKVKISENSQLKNIFYGAFSNCKKLDSFIVRSSVVSINDSAFANCSSLKEIKFDDTKNLKLIGSKAFIGCSKLEIIEIPSSVAVIGSQAFNDCTSLKQISIPSFIDTNDIGITSAVKVIKT